MIKTLTNLSNQTLKEIKIKYNIIEDDGFRGKCIEAAELLSDKLSAKGIECEVIEGWCEYDDPMGCSDRPYDEHTWVEVEGIYVDVTACQFSFYMDEAIPPVIVGEKPYYMHYEEPEEDF